MSRTIGTHFAILDVLGSKRDCADFERRVKHGKEEIHVHLMGVIDAAWSDFDGTSQEFSIDVKRAVEGDGTITAGDMHYDKEDSTKLRQYMIQLRDAALSNGNVEGALKLGHVVAWMAAMIEEHYGDPPTE